MKPFSYRVTVTRVVDGDTVDVDIDLGFNLWLSGRRIRFYGINTPETRTRDLEEKARGLAAKARLRELLDGQDVTLLSHGTGKYGRVLGVVYAWGISVSPREGSRVGLFSRNPTALPS